MNKFWLLCSFCCLPLKRVEITSSYGYRLHPLTRQYHFHGGIDLRAHADTAYAVLPGRIEAAGFDPSLGVYIRLVQGDFEFTYGHLSLIFVLPGDSVDAAAPIAITGFTGRVTGEHLHFSVRFRHTRLDPLEFLRMIINNFQTNK
jgi:murein DD-endopeptidase MepM/ murein hydrolase activator NlpD